MKISSLIFDYLKRKEHVTVPEFGHFEFENSRAEITSENDKILPPAKKIIFNVDYKAQNPDFLNFICAQKNINRENATFELKTQTDFWKKKITVGDQFEIEGLGTFIIGDKDLVFKGKRVEIESPDFYGLEEISFSEIKNKVQNQMVPKKQDYRFNNSILWIFLLVIPICGLVYLGITKQELLFGKKSFDDLSVKNSTHRIEDSKPQKAEIKISDSTKIDSLKSNSTIQNIDNQ